MFEQQRRTPQASRSYQGHPEFFEHSRRTSPDSPAPFPDPMSHSNANAARKDPQSGRGSKQSARRPWAGPEVYGNGEAHETWMSTMDTSGGSHEDTNPCYACSDNTDSDFDPVASGHHRASAPRAEEDADWIPGFQPLSGDGQHETLRLHGEMRSDGSLRHPHGCRPCAFFCFSLRGCNRGARCQFCHMKHESKLKQRREEWKRQQREKHGRVQKQAGPQAPAALGASPQQLFRGPEPDIPDESFASFVPAARPKEERPARGRRAEMDVQPGRHAEMNVQPGGQPQFHQVDLEPGGVIGFDYQLKQVVVAVGQQLNFVARTRFPDQTQHHFSVRPALPAGIHLDASTGTISGAALAPSDSSFDFDLHVITCRLQLNDWSFSFTHAELGLKVVNFGSNDFVVSHLSEVADGRFMILFTSVGDQQAAFHAQPPQQAVAPCGYSFPGLATGSAPAQL